MINYVSLRVNKVILAFIDIEKVIDSTEQNTLFKVLRETRVDYHDRRIILQLYKNRKAVIGPQAKISKFVR